MFFFTVTFVFSPIVKRTINQVFFDAKNIDLDCDFSDLFACVCHPCDMSVVVPLYGVRMDRFGKAQPSSSFSFLSPSLSGSLPQNNKLIKCFHSTLWPNKICL